MLVSDFIEYLTSIGILAKESLGKFQAKSDNININDKDILLRDEQYEVNNIDNYIKKEEVSLVDGNTILTYY